LAIIQSKHRALAIKLLSARIVEPDFAVTTVVLEQLTAMGLESKFPDAFSRGDDDFRRQLYPPARQILQEHVLALGNSLPDKDEASFPSSTKTFKIYAREQFCTGQPLVPSSASRQVLRGVHADAVDPDPVP
jgi:hypothetical protein